MPYAITHILAVIILVEIFRDFFVKNNKTFPRYYILIAAIGAIIPDLDIAAYYILYFFGFTFDQIHKTFFHTLFIPIILFLIGFASLKINFKSQRTKKMHLKISTIFFIFSFGASIHILLDSIFDNNLMLFYPISNFSAGFNLVSVFPKELRWLILPTLDGILLLFWIFWMEFKLKINDYF